MRAGGKDENQKLISGGGDYSSGIAGMDWAAGGAQNAFNAAQNTINSASPYSAVTMAPKYDASRFNFSRSLDPLISGQLARTQSERGEQLANVNQQLASTRGLSGAQLGALKAQNALKTALSGNSDNFNAASAQQALDLSKEQAQQQRYQIANNAQYQAGNLNNQNFQTSLLPAGYQNQLFGLASSAAGLGTKTSNADYGSGEVAYHVGDYVQPVDWRTGAGGEMSRDLFEGAAPFRPSVGDQAVPQQKMLNTSGGLFNMSTANPWASQMAKWGIS